MENKFVWHCACWFKSVMIEASICWTFNRCDIFSRLRQGAWWFLSFLNEWPGSFWLSINQKNWKNVILVVQYSNIIPQVLSQAVVHCHQATPVLVSPLSLNNTATKEFLQTLWYINIYLWLMSKCHINIVYFLTIAME